jgi:hypothetical protein
MHSLISELIGDPDKDHLWKPWNSASEEDIKNFHLAREAVKNWIKQLFIELFFNKIAQDADRRRMDFWRKKLKFIENFKIFGQDPDFNKLNRHPLIRPRLWEHWGTLEGDSHQSVFVMEVDDYILIEFGKTGGGVLRS